eukprot:Nk52_evm1s2309 gene=Nk52_evmTU1s2309
MGILLLLVLYFAAPVLFLQSTGVVAAPVAMQALEGAQASTEGQSGSAPVQGPLDDKADNSDNDTGEQTDNSEDKVHNKNNKKKEENPYKNKPAILPFTFPAGDISTIASQTLKIAPEMAPYPILSEEVHRLRNGPDSPRDSIATAKTSQALAAYRNRRNSSISGSESTNSPKETLEKLRGSDKRLLAEKQLDSTGYAQVMPALTLPYGREFPGVGETKRKQGEEQAFVSTVNGINPVSGKDYKNSHPYSNGNVGSNSNRGNDMIVNYSKVTDPIDKIDAPVGPNVEAAIGKVTSDDINIKIITNDKTNENIANFYLRRRGLVRRSKAVVGEVFETRSPRDGTSELKRPSLQRVPLPFTASQIPYSNSDMFGPNPTSSPLHVNNEQVSARGGVLQHHEVSILHSGYTKLPYNMPVDRSIIAPLLTEDNSRQAMNPAHSSTNEQNALMMGFRGYDQIIPQGGSVRVAVDPGGRDATVQFAEDDEDSSGSAWTTSYGGGGANTDSSSKGSGWSTSYGPGNEPSDSGGSDWSTEYGAKDANPSESSNNEDEVNDGDSGESREGSGFETNSGNQSTDKAGDKGSNTSNGNNPYIDDYDRRAKDGSDMALNGVVTITRKKQIWDPAPPTPRIGTLSTNPAFLKHEANKFINNTTSQEKKKNAKKSPSAKAKKKLDSKNTVHKQKAAKTNISAVIQPKKQSQSVSYPGYYHTVDPGYVVPLNPNHPYPPIPPSMGYAPNTPPPFVPHPPLPLIYRSQEYLQAASLPFYRHTLPDMWSDRMLSYPYMPDRFAAPFASLTDPYVNEMMEISSVAQNDNQKLYEPPKYNSAANSKQIQEKPKGDDIKVPDREEKVDDSDKDLPFRRRRRRMDISYENAVRELAAKIIISNGKESNYDFQSDQEERPSVQQMAEQQKRIIREAAERADQETAHDGLLDNIDHARMSAAQPDMESFTEILSRTLDSQ